MMTTTTIMKRIEVLKIHTSNVVRHAYQRKRRTAIQTMWLAIYIHSPNDCSSNAICNISKHFDELKNNIHSQFTHSIVATPGPPSFRCVSPFAFPLPFMFSCCSWPSTNNVHSWNFSSLPFWLWQSGAAALLCCGVYFIINGICMHTFYILYFMWAWVCTTCSRTNKYLFYS